MSGRRSRSVPSYRLHKQSGQAIVTLTDGSGRRRDVLLGEHGTAASRVEYARVIAEWETSGRRVPTPAAGPGLSVAELLLAYLEHALVHYRDADGRPTSELADVKLSIKPVRELYADTPAADFGPLALKAVRARMVGAGLARGVVNQRVGRIKRAFKWAVSEQLVPSTVLVGLQSVAGLQAGRTAARETEPVRPVRPELVEATLPFLSPTVRAMVQVQRLTGMRPAEVCRMRACEIDMTGAVWLYRPARHKTRYRGKERVVALGPKAQAIVREFLQLDLSAPLFSPRRAVAAQVAERRAARKSKLWPSHVKHQAKKRKARPRRPPRDEYDVAGYRRAIFRACDRAFPPPDAIAKAAGETDAAWLARLTPDQRAELAAWRKAHRWHPNRLRHLFATEVRKQYGLEAAQVGLGHSRADVTQIYAERNLALAEKIAREVG